MWRSMTSSTSLTRRSSSAVDDGRNGAARFVGNDDSASLSSSVRFVRIFLRHSSILRRVLGLAYRPSAMNRSGRHEPGGGPGSAIYEDMKTLFPARWAILEKKLPR